MIRDRLRIWWNTYGRRSGAALRHRPPTPVLLVSPHH